MTKLWIRVDADAPDDPAINELGDRLGIDPMQALGHCMAVWGVIAKHATDGGLGTVSDATLERWARWPKRRGAFAEVFRGLFLGDDGHLHGWHSRQGKLIDRAERERRRWHKRAQDSAETPRSEQPTSAEGKGKPPRRKRGDSTITVRNGTVQRNTQDQKLVASGVATLPAGEASPSDQPPKEPPAEPTTNGRAATWLDPIADAYEGEMGVGSFPWGKAGKLLKPLSAHHLPEKIAQNLYEYLRLTEARFVNLAKFAETFAQWDFKPRVDADGVMTARGEKIFAVSR